MEGQRQLGTDVEGPGDKVTPPATSSVLHQCEGPVGVGQGVDVDGGRGAPSGSTSAEQEGLGLLPVVENAVMKAINFECASSEIKPNSFQEISWSDVKTIEKGKGDHVPIEYLPDEMFLNILSHLEHGDLLIARLVCKSWNRKLSSSPTFTKRVTYVLRADSQEETILEQIDCSKKSIQWRSIKIQNISKTTLDVIQKLPSYLEDSLTELIFQEGELAWSVVEAAAERFPRLESLQLLSTDRVLSEVENSKPKTPATPKYEAFKGRLKSLLISSDSVRNVEFYLNQLRGANRLRTLDLDLQVRKGELTETLAAPSNALVVPRFNMPESEDLARSLSEALSATAKTLKSLVIRGYPHRALYPVVLDLDLGERLHLETFVLDLNSYTRRIHSFRECPMHHSDPFLKFLKTQPGLRRLFVPDCILQGTDAMSLLSGFPARLRSVTFENVRMLSAELFDLMENLEELKLYFPLGTRAKFMEALGSRIFQKVTSLTVVGGTGNIVGTIVSAFPNLLQLEIGAAWDRYRSHPQGLYPPIPIAPSPDLNDQGLQTLIRSFPRIQVLHLYSSDGFTDLGISGVGPEDAGDLMAFSTVYLQDDFAKTKVNRIGVPLSDLTNLKDLHLESESRKSKVGDVGVGYGLACKNLRKVRISCSSGGYKMSTWGWAALHLAESNPSLESMTILTGAPLPISPEGMLHLQKLCPRLPPRNVQLLTGPNRLWLGLSI